MVVNINGASFGRERYPTIEEKMVAHLYFIIKNHPFTDGNKRAAVLVFVALCILNNQPEPRVKYNLGALAVFLEKYQGNDHQNLIKDVAKMLFDNSY